MSRRVQSVDALRGLVMIIMALDHTRDFFHHAATQFQPEDLTRTTSAIFFTRWITHFCAPAFMFTAGLGAWFWFSRGRTKAQLSAYLVKRGLWLMLLELTVVRLALTFGEGIFIITVLWGLGLSMIVLALLTHLPIRILAPFSIAVIALHNLLDPVTAAQFGKASWIWSLLHTLAPFNIGSVTVQFSYPLIPWFAVMALGFCFGQLFTREPELRRKWMIRIGLATSIAFVALRFLNLYGDPFSWSGGVLSFLRVNKYPPSLDFLLMTLGPAILLLALFEKIKFSSLNPLMVFGRTPLFYFLAHLAIIHLLTIPFAWIRYGKWMMINPVLRIYPQGYGYPLWFVYVLWFVIVAMLYPMCFWYSRIQSARATRALESSSGTSPMRFGWDPPNL